MASFKATLLIDENGLLKTHEIARLDARDQSEAYKKATIDYASTRRQFGFINGEEVEVVPTTPFIIKMATFEPWIPGHFDEDEF